MTPADKTPVWYVLDQSGFDRVMPAATQSRGLEVIRDYLGDDGKPVTTLNLGQEVTVRLRVRALDANERSDIAIVDLLPAGFEPVLQTPAPTADSAAADTSTDEQNSDSSDGSDSEDGRQSNEIRTSHGRPPSIQLAPGSPNRRVARLLRPARRRGRCRQMERDRP